MVTKLVFVASAAIVLLGIFSEATAQYRHGAYGYGQHHNPYYQQQRPGYGGFGGYPQQNEYQLPPGVSVQEAEWVCKNPKTGDMLIISSEDLPAGVGNIGQPQQPNNPQPNFPPINTQPTFSQPPPSYPTQSPPQPSTEAPISNGDGVIDIRALE